MKPTLFVLVFTCFFSYAAQYQKDSSCVLCDKSYTSDQKVIHHINTNCPLIHSQPLTAQQKGLLANTYLEGIQELIHSPLPPAERTPENFSQAKSALWYILKEYPNKDDNKHICAQALLLEINELLWENEDNCLDR